MANIKGNELEICMHAQGRERESKWPGEMERPGKIVDEAEVRYKRPGNGEENTNDRGIRPERGR